MEPTNTSQETGPEKLLEDLIEQSRRLREQSNILARKVAALNEKIDQIKQDPQLERLATDAPKIDIENDDGFAHEASASTP